MALTAKAEHERTVFLEFVGAAGLSVHSNTVTCRPQGEPDVLCELGQQEVYFELGRLLDQEMQRARLRALRIAPQMVAMSNYRVRLPEREMLRKKLGSSYATFGKPVELLLYYDDENWLVGDVQSYPGDFAHHAKHVMVPLIDEAPARFRRVWVYERFRKLVLWRYPIDP
ncbi:MAG: hypothetical protein K2P58_05345 [Hyphomonadaceae bacterium]|nr:hypothetical protein [Hyphomonadaceae bacterium]